MVAQAGERLRPHAARPALERLGMGELPGTLLRRVRLAPGLVLGLEALFEHDGRRAAERLHDRESVALEAEAGAAFEHRVAAVAVLRDPHGAPPHGEVAAGRIAQLQQLAPGGRPRSL